MKAKLLMLALLAVMGPGCTFLPKKDHAVSPPSLPEAAPVSPDEVTPNNAYDKARELQRELNKDLEG